MSNTTNVERKNVLLIDDSATIHKIVELIVDKRTFSLISAFNTADALSLISDPNLSVVMIDSRLFAEASQDFFVALRALGGKVGIILLVGAYEQFVDMDIEHALIDDYLVKPFNSITINQVLDKIMVRKGYHYNNSSSSDKKSSSENVGESVKAQDFGTDGNVAIFGTDDITSGDGNVYINESLLEGMVAGEPSEGLVSLNELDLQSASAADFEATVIGSEEQGTLFSNEDLDKFVQKDAPKEEQGTLFSDDDLDKFVQKDAPKVENLFETEDMAIGEITGEIAGELEQEMLDKLQHSLQAIQTTPFEETEKVQPVPQQQQPQQQMPQPLPEQAQRRGVLTTSDAEREADDEAERLWSGEYSETIRAAATGEREELMSLFDEVNRGYLEAKNSGGEPIMGGEHVPALSTSVAVASGVQQAAGAGALTIALSQEDLVGLLGQSASKNLLEKAVADALTSKVSETVNKLVPELAERLVREELKLIKGAK
ncbi:hypothetical protein RsTz2092_05220 [Deferribacterales bacterium RsTz2092]|nr:hypothetical protein AGMMS49941_00890 [Deferribacterales bacterium]